jgi:hypothetical protein
MEALLLIIVVAFIAFIIYALWEPVAAIGLFIFVWMRAIWPFLLGCFIGIPIWLTGAKTLGNFLVIGGLVGNIIYWKKMRKKR